MAVQRIAVPGNQDLEGIALASKNTLDNELIGVVAVGN
jgi:hypothetical protein